MKRICVVVLIEAILVMSIASCKRNEPDNIEKKQIVLAMVYHDDEETREDPALEEQIERFNETHIDYEIITKEYNRSDNMLDDGVNQIQREIVSGEGPDIINYRYDYSKADIIGKYTEDMSTYIEGDEIQDSLYMNLIDSFRIDDSLYAIPLSVQLNTYVGRISEIGNIQGWDVKTMLDVFNRVGKKYPLGYNTKVAVLGDILYASMDDFVDWENGKNYFDGEEFREILKFANMFDYEYNQNMSDYNFEECVVRPLIIGDVYATAIAEGELGTQDVVYAGFPSKSHAGTIVAPCGNVMAISMASNYKEQAWEFIKQLLSTDYQEKANERGTLSINKEVVKNQLELATKEEWSGSEKKMKASYTTNYSYDNYPIYTITEKQKRDFNNLMDHATRSSTDDEKINTIIYDEVDAYFAGQKSLDEVVRNIENRTWIYISEKGK